MKLSKSYIFSALVLFSAVLFFLPVNNAMASTDASPNRFSFQQVLRADPLQSIAYGKGVYVAVGGNNCVKTSVDGVAWTSHAIELNNQCLRYIAFNGTIFVAKGYGNLLMTSTDGINWTKRASLGFYGEIFCYGNEFLIRNENGSLMKSTDGVNWTFTPYFDYISINAAAYNGNQYVIASINGDIWTSTDYSNWTKGPMTLPYVHFIRWCNDKFIAKTEYGLYYSYNGKDWLKSTIDTVESILDIDGENNKYLAVGENGKIYNSNDGIVWNAISSPIQSKITDLLWTGQKYICVSPGGFVLTSDNGTNWTNHTISGLDKPANMKSIAYGNNKFVAVGDAIVSSSDGLNWIKQHKGWNLNCVIWGKNQFIAVGENGKVCISLDGNTWTEKNSGLTVNLVDVAWNGTSYIAIGENSSYIYISNDGITWSSKNIFKSLLCIEAKPGLFVIGGDSGQILTSTDGVTWTTKTTSTTKAIRNIKWNSNKFVATTEIGRIYKTDASDGLVSTDANNWYIMQNYDATAAIAIDDFIVGVDLTYVDTILPSGFSNFEWLPNTAHLQDIVCAGTKLVLVGLDSNIFLGDTSQVILPTRIEVSSDITGLVTVPTSGQKTYRFNGYFTNSYNDRLNNGTIGWEVTSSTGTTPNGITIDDAGTLTIASTADHGECIVKAYMKERPEVFRRYSFHLYYTEANISSTKYTIEPSTLTISNIPYGTAYTDLIKDLVISKGALISMEEPVRDPNAIGLVSGTKLIITSEDRVTKKTYTLQVNKNTATTIASNAYQVDNASLQILNIPYGVYLNDFLGRLILPYHATCRALNNAGAEVKSGIILPGMKLSVVAEDGISTRTFNLFLSTDINRIYTKNPSEILEKGKTLQLTTNLILKGVYSNNIVWRSENPGIATVSSTGLVTAVKAGYTKIWATSTDNNLYTVRSMITVVDKVATNLNSEFNEVRTYKSDMLMSMAYGNFRYVAVGKGGIIKSSVDKLNWSTCNTPTDKSLTSVIWTGVKFVAVGLYGTILTSTDGLTWLATSSGVETHLTDIAFSGSKLVAVGFSASNANIALVSTDGITWKQVTLSINSDLYSIVWGKNQFVAVGEANTAITSPDGENWTLQSIDAVHLNAVSWNGTKYVAVGDSGSVAISNDGISWITTIGVIQNQDFRSIVCSSGKFIASSNTGSLYSSSNGTYWIPISLNSPETYGIMHLTYGTAYCNNQFFSLGVQGTIFASSDGVSWSFCSKGIAYTLNDIAWNGSLYVAVGFPGKILTSPDGKIWTERASSTTGNILTIAWSGRMFMALAPNELLYSYDGITWHKTNYDNSPYLKIIWNGEEFVAVGYDWQFSSKEDLTRSIGSNMPNSGPLYGLVWGDGVYIAVGHDNRTNNVSIITSYNRSSWTNIPMNVPGTLYGVTYNGSKYIAVGGNTTIDNANVPSETTIIMYSEDGLNWHNLTTSDIGTLYNIIWTGNEFIAIGDGFVMSTTDGINWVLKDADNNMELYGIATNGSNLVTVGDMGAISTSAFSTNIAPMDLTLNKSSTNLFLGQSEQLIATLIPAETTNKNIIWTVVSGSNTVSVSSSGLITGLSTGTATIRATCEANNTIYAECTVTVALLYGDVNGDGVVNNSDAAMFKSCLLGAGAISYPANADLDGNSLINSKDYALLTRMLK